MGEGEGKTTSDDGGHLRGVGAGEAVDDVHAHAEHVVEGKAIVGIDGVACNGVGPQLAHIRASILRGK